MKHKTIEVLLRALVIKVINHWIRFLKIFLQNISNSYYFFTLQTQFNYVVPRYQNVTWLHSLLIHLTKITAEGYTQTESFNSKFCICCFVLFSNHYDRYVHGFIT